MEKGLSLDIYRNSGFSNSTSKQFSHVNKYLYLVSPNEKSPIAVFEIEDKSKIFIVQRKVFKEKEYFSLVKKYPTDEEKQMRGPMFGGCFASTNDSRFPFDYPLPIHDRYEE